MKIRVSWVGQSTNVRGNSLWKMTRWWAPPGSGVLECSTSSVLPCPLPAELLSSSLLIHISWALCCLFSSELVLQLWVAFRLSSELLTDLWNTLVPPNTPGYPRSVPKDNQRRDKKAEGQIAPSEKGCRLKKGTRQKERRGQIQCCHLSHFILKKSERNQRNESCFPTYCSAYLSASFKKKLNLPASYLLSLERSLV